MCIEKTNIFVFQAIEGQDGFLAIFKTVNGRGKYESAMCSYSYDEIRRYFNSGEFGNYLSVEYAARQNGKLPDV